MLTVQVTERVRRLERHLDVTDPGAGGVEVLDSGEVSAVLRHPDMPGLVLKRVGGFRSTEEALRYTAAVVEYVAGLVERGVPCVTTDCLVAPSKSGRRWAAYIVQPLVPAEHRGKVWLAAASAESVVSAVLQVAELGARAHTVVASASGPLGLAIDAQLSNWVFEEARVVALLDVTTPLYRRSGRNMVECEAILRGFPVGLRNWLRRTGQVEHVFDVHFGRRSNVVDIVANLHKEGRSEVIGPAVDAANRWLADQGERAGITAREVLAYYQRNARAMEFSSRVRRLDARVHRWLRRPYQAILPTPVERYR
ncbi:DUF6206 family protein [Amycolatopsis sp. cmx-4-68]|uniref:DUF6206 family protein n=1 Tax=Amycolatopsis sp. cmx-4-68 TaxID=2790938 RepID=UPI00397D5E14